MRDAPLRGTPPPPARRGLERQTSFLVVAIVAAVGMGMVFWMGRPGKDGAPPNNRAEAPLSSQEALRNEYRRLVEATINIFRARNADLIASVYTTNSPLIPQLQDGVDGLVRRNVLDKSEVVIQRLEVTSMSNGGATLREIVRIYPCFIDESSGQDVTETPGIIEQTNKVVLRLEMGTWQIHEHATLSERVVREARTGCS